MKTEISLVDKNIAIAKMLGWKFEERNQAWASDWQQMDGLTWAEEWTPSRKLKFHSDWNWLMKAVDFIESKGYFFDTLKHITTVSDGVYQKQIVESSEGKRIDTSFEAVYQFSQYSPDQTKAI